ncbi:hypothetical protein VP1G_03725 [Cytospora mali]|uniref:AMMECR1 domain-containing protein n=1 Tax=Cytospora mali TaxID=578113 RepID=A0A194UXT5_CYTMA|nr:hypothetical protein VP1G_03725 [Valsa mali var. pyri (nom. inval.)]
MATVEHCLYCFDSLAAQLEGREPMGLDEVQKSYAEYTAYLASDEAAADEDNTDDNPTTAATIKKLPALRRLVGSSPSDNSLPSGSSSSTSLSADTDATSISTSTSTTTTTTTTTTPVTDPEAEYPLFVTWNKLSGGEYNLRGCIGTFEAQRLADGLSSYAVIAALHDSRFHRVTSRELPSLQCAVTLLTDFEDADHLMDWEVGVHGIRISFQFEGRRYGSTYLPDVAKEQGWNREQALVSLMRKAGWEGKRDRWREVAEKGRLKVVRYRGDKEAVVYAEYKGWKDWVDEYWGKKGGK